MTKYEVEFDIPMWSNPYQVDAFIEALRECGHPKIIFRAETSEELNTKKKLADEIANSVSGSWDYYFDKFGPEWWYENLKANRKKED